MKKILDEQFCLFIFIILLIIIYFLIPDCNLLEKFKSKPKISILDQIILKNNEYLIYFDDNKKIYIRDNNLINLDLKKNDIIAIKKKYKAIINENTKEQEELTSEIYFKIDTIDNEIKYSLINLSIDNNTKTKINKIENIPKDEKEKNYNEGNNMFHKVFIYKIGNIDTNCILSKNISVEKKNNDYILKFNTDIPEIKYNYFNKFRVDDVITIKIMDEFEDSSHNKFLIINSDDINYTFTLQNNQFLKEINTEKEKKEILIIKEDIGKILSDYYNSLKEPLGNLSYSRFIINNLTDDVDNLLEKYKEI